MPYKSASQALSRFKVLDLTRVRAGPTAVRQLADWGANVIKIEQPVTDSVGQLGGPRNSSDFQNLHRNKRSLTLNLKSEAGLEVLRRLAADADVVVENYRPDVKHRLGVDYESLKAINPRLIYASISGFGQDGPYAKRPGFDQIAQGMGGLMSITGLPGQGPVRVGIPIADLTAGLMCAQGILVALLERDVSGQGQWISSSLLEAQIFMLDFQAARWLMDGVVAPQAGNNHPTSIPTGVFETADGHVNIAVSGQEMWHRLCKALGTPDLAEREGYATPADRSRNRDRLNADIDAVTRTKPSDAWIEILNTAGVPCGAINSIDRVFADPQVRHLGIARDVIMHERGPTQVVGQPVRLSRTPSEIAAPTPKAGEHTDEILKEIGYAEAEIAQLRAEKAI